MRLAFALLLSVFLTACGSRIDAMSDTLRYAFEGKNDITLTQQQIESLSYPAQYLSVNANPRVVVGLGFDNDGWYKWQSQNKAVLTTRRGRIVNTQGLAKDIAYFSVTSQTDPLSCLSKSGRNCESQWSYIVQVGDGVDAVVESLNASFRLKSEQETITLDSGREFDVSVWEETVSAGQQSWRNYFYVEDNTNRVIKSSQQLNSQGPRFYMEEVKAYRRDIDKESSR